VNENRAEDSADVGPHVGLKRLTAYRQGRLPAQDREALQEHLSLCPRCTGLLRELRDFEAAARDTGAAGPPSLREEAWASLVRHLPGLSSKPPTIRPISAGRQVPRANRVTRFFYAAAASLALAVVGFSLWSAITSREESRRVARLEHRLQAREEALAALRQSLAKTEHQLGEVRGQLRRLETEKAERAADAPRIEELTARVAELTTALAELRRTSQPERTVLASKEIDLSVSPRFALRGQKPSELQGAGTVNSVRVAPPAGRFTVSVNLAHHPTYGEYRFELLARDGEVLWSGRRPGKGLLGDAGTSVTVSGIGAGLYRLRIEGLREKRTDFLGEYLLEVSFNPAPS
jgi:anti-sigma factor RsiW